MTYSNNCPSPFPCSRKPIKERNMLTRVSTTGTIIRGVMYGHQVPLILLEKITHMCEQIMEKEKERIS